MPQSDLTPESQVPSVSVDELKRFRKIGADAYAAILPGETSHVGIDIGVFSDPATPASGMAIWLRASLIEAMLRDGVLDPWLKKGVLDDAVFNVAAVWPIASVEEFSPQEFVEALQDE